MRRPRHRRSIHITTPTSRARARGIRLHTEKADSAEHLLAADSAAAVMPADASLAKLLSAHILRDGEVVILVLRPSPWFVPLSCLRFLITAVILLGSLHYFSVHAMITHGTARSLAELGSSAIFARLMWAALQWMSRLYILTDLRVLAVSGVFTVNIFDCPLRKVARTRLVRTNPERTVGAGSIEIIPQDDTLSFGIWQTISKPFWVREQIVATIKRAKQGGE